MKVRLNSNLKTRPLPTDEHTITAFVAASGWLPVMTQTFVPLASDHSPNRAWMPPTRNIQKPMRRMPTRSMLVIGDCTSAVVPDRLPFYTSVRSIAAKLLVNERAGHDKSHEISIPLSRFEHKSKGN